MTRHLFIFLGTFLAGVVIALGARTALHQPHANHGTSTAPAAAPAAKAAPAADAHAAHPVATQATAPAAAPTAKPVNTVCAICGMSVDPSLPTVTYQGKTIGFGCRMCPPKFKADPDKYGPLYLRNEVVTR